MDKKRGMILRTQTVAMCLILGFAWIRIFEAFEQAIIKSESVSTKAAFLVGGAFVGILQAFWAENLSAKLMERKDSWGGKQ